MEQHKDKKAKKDFQIVSRKSNEEISDDLAKEVTADENETPNEIEHKKFHKIEGTGNGVED